MAGFGLERGDYAPLSSPPVIIRFLRSFVSDFFSSYSAVELYSQFRIKGADQLLFPKENTMRISTLNTALQLSLRNDPSKGEGEDQDNQNPEGSDGSGQDQDQDGGDEGQGDSDTDQDGSDGSDKGDDKSDKGDKSEKSDKGEKGDKSNDSDKDGDQDGDKLSLIHI